MSEHNPLLTYARQVMAEEATAIQQAALKLDEQFLKAVELIRQHSGKIVVTGVGKSGFIGQKMVATLCSTGTQAVFMHPSDAFHGDLGIYQPGDPSILISKSGATAEIVRLLPVLKQFNSPLIAITGNLNSVIAQESDLVLNGWVEKETDPYNIVPTSSTTVALALGDALAMALMKEKNFTETDFARFHPGGLLGRRLTLTVADIMHPLEQSAQVKPEQTLREAIIAMTRFPLGAALVLNPDQTLAGIITDGDIRRLLASRDDVLSLSLREVMNTQPSTIKQEAMVNDALHLMENREKQINVLPVTEQGKCTGLLRLHDLYQVG